MKRQFVIGIDIGTSGCKCILLDERGKVLASVTKDYPLYTPKPGWAEQNPEDWWRATKISIRQILKRLDSIRNIKAIGLSGQMHGLVILDKNSRVIRPAILWNDQRTEKQCQEIQDKVGGINGLLELTNNRMLPGYTGGKILWVRENQPHFYDRIKKILNPKDYIRFRLTGEFATEVSDASGTGLFNVRKRDWSYRLLELLDIPKEWLPRCYESCEISGALSAKIAKELGLPVGLPVVGGGGDAVVQTTGTGIIEPGILGTTIGTAGNVTTALDKCIENPDGKLQIFCNTLPGKWHVMGVTLAAGGSLRWFRDALGEFEKERAKRLGKDIYEILTREASGIEVGSEGLLFLPYLIGERCPYADPHAKGALIGLTLRHKKRHFIRSILEGVIFSLRDVAEVILKMGISFNQIRTSGGGARSKLWRQIHADVFGREVLTMSGSGEGSAYGAALVAGVGVGIWPNMEEAVKGLKIVTNNSPIPENVEKYEKLFKIYQNLYKTLKPTFDKISELYFSR
ncbi:MAG: xylulokinase [Candidatus Anstonellales archaeon]